VTCPRCGARLSSYLCPRCDSRQSPGKIPFFSDNFMPRVSTPAVDSLVTALATKIRGKYRHFPQERRWKPGETELYRGELESIRIFTVDGYTRSGRPAACILTDQTLMLHDRWSGLVRVPLATVHSTAMHRDVNVLGVASCWISIRLMGGAVHEPRGDICLVCRSQQQGRELIRILADAVPARASARVRL
jgi:hypothetical protein